MDAVSRDSLMAAFLVMVSLVVTGSRECSVVRRTGCSSEDPGLVLSTHVVVHNGL